VVAARRPIGVLVYDAHDAARYAALIRAPRGRVTIRAAATPDEARPLVAEADVLFAWNFPRELYAKAARLRWLQVMGAGVDRALVPEVPESVVVTRIPGVYGPWMAEYVLGWCLWVTQRMATYRAAQHDRRWAARDLPARLRGTTMAIVGLGDIGRTIGRAARGMGVRVIGVNRSGRPVAGVERVYPTTAIRRAVADADWVVLVVPPVLAAMRPSAWLLNVARGAIVDETALVQALERRHIAGAILDVFGSEPLPPGHPLWRLDNAVITPHISGPSTPEELTPIFNDNLARFLAGRRLRHVVRRARGY
jgi:glyoxylate/hydroxypyruvate reductase A